MKTNTMKTNTVMGPTDSPGIRLGHRGLNRPLPLLLLLALFACLASSGAFAMDMDVKVTQGGTAVDGARVVIHDLFGNDVAKGTTKAGSYTANNLKAGRYQVSVDYQGVNNIKAATISQGKNTTVTFTIKKQKP